MMQGSKRRGLAALVSALAAVALALAVGGRGCGDKGDQPDSAVQEFLDKARSGDEQAVYALLGPRTRAWLDRESQRATHMVGGSQRYDAFDLMVARGAPPPARVAVVERSGDRAQVEVVDQQGKSSVVELVRQDGQWRIELIATERGER